jgi:hypothetical protein
MKLFLISFALVVVSYALAAVSCPKFLVLSEISKLFFTKNIKTNLIVLNRRPNQPSNDRPARVRRITD